MNLLLALGDRDARLLAAVDTTMEAAARCCGAFLACRPACTECCIGPFPIAALEAGFAGPTLVALALFRP